MIRACGAGLPPVSMDLRCKSKNAERKLGVQGQKRQRNKAGV